MVLAQHLHQSGFQLYLASAGPALELLRLECPEIPSFELPAYQIRYTRASMHANIARQFPHLIRTALREHNQIAGLIKSLGIELLINDMRFGSFCSGVPSILVNHQLRPFFQLGCLEPFGQWVYQRWLRQFREIWVPDNSQPNRISGALSQHLGKKWSIQYLGILSRFQPKERPALSYDFDWLLLLSGPEPQRSFLEQLLLRQLHPDWRVALVRGTSKHHPPLRRSKLTCIDLATTTELEALIQNSRYVCCRSGYSSVMDLRALKKQALLIPTPGQTEQLYLAQRAQEAGWAISMPQKKVDLATAWEQLQQRPIQRVGNLVTPLTLKQLVLRHFP